MATIRYGQIKLNTSKLKTVEDVGLVLELMNWSVKIPESLMEEAFILKGVDRGIFELEARIFDRDTQTDIKEETKEEMLEKTLAQVKEAQSEVENKQDNTQE
jgi:hypothetical protein